MPQLSPAAWLERLERRLDERWNQIGVYDAYYEGLHRLTFASDKFREAFGNLFGPLANNWMPIVVDSSVERMTVQGFRFGDEQEADSDAWDIWQENGLDAASDQVHTEAVKLGEAYWLVEPNGDVPRITAEHPSQVIVAWAPGNRYERLAALKKWVDEDTYAYANLYLPERIIKWRSKSKLREGGLTGGRISWTQIEQGSNPLGVVPVVPVCNKPSLLRGGVSDLQPCIPIQNAINKMCCDLLISSEYMSFQQRVLIGVDVPRDPETGQPTRASQQKVSQQRLMVFPDPEAKIAEFTAADLDNITNAIRLWVQHLSAQTRTPPHYILGEIINASGDALKAAETGLVSKVRQKMSPFGEAHEETIRLAFKAMGETSKSEAMDAETIWADPESRSQAELADALTKLKSLGVPDEVLWERYGFSPQEIERMKSMQTTEDLLAAAQSSQNGQVPPEVPVAPPAGQPARL